MNPAVRVGHNADTYEIVANGSSWPPTGEIIRGWFKSFRVWLSLPWRNPKIYFRYVKWRLENRGNEEFGMDCAIDEMQVVRWYDWAHV